MPATDNGRELTMLGRTRSGNTAVVLVPQAADEGASNLPYLETRAAFEECLEAAHQNGKALIGDDGLGHWIVSSWVADNFDCRAFQETSLKTGDGTRTDVETLTLREFFLARLNKGSQVSSIR